MKKSDPLPFRLAHLPCDIVTARRMVVFLSGDESEEFYTEELALRLMKWHKSKVRKEKMRLNRESKEGVGKATQCNLKFPVTVEEIEIRKAKHREIRMNKIRRGADLIKAMQETT